MELFDGALTLGGSIFLVLALGLALSFEFVNGFHDTANAVATVIYTHTLPPTVAVVWSGCWNLIGVLTSSGGVAFGVVALLPAELILNVGSAAGFAMVFALLISAIIWNLGTWYLGLPASSSHTLIGSILGVGLANSLLSSGRSFGEGVNWGKAAEVGISLLVSPLVGFTFAALLLLLAKAVIRRKDLYCAPEPGSVPPRWIRGLLILTCTAVSFGHGSNDGQKGMGLIMLILIGILPLTYAVDLGTGEASIQQLATVAGTIATEMDRHSNNASAPPDQLTAYLKSNSAADERTFAAIGEKCRGIAALLNAKTTLKSLDKDQRRVLRSNIYLTSESLGKLVHSKEFDAPDERASAAAFKIYSDKLTKFIPFWVKAMVAMVLGLGTMIGWKRIVVTVGEKIGKEHLTYAQGAAAELVAAGTIIAADMFNLPVSTTHVLSSGIAGTMAANHSGIQMNTVRNLLVAWVLTLPVCVFLGASIFAFGLNLLIRFGIR
jgi:PiT family inorganic phosphate transporter